MWFVVVCIIIILLIFWYGIKQNELFHNCVKTAHCANNIMPPDTTRLNPYYFPYSAAPCMKTMHDKALYPAVPYYLDVVSKTVPDHVMLTN
jgi:hypothetical protein